MEEEEDKIVSISSKYVGKILNKRIAYDLCCKDYFMPAFSARCITKDYLIGILNEPPIYATFSKHTQRLAKSPMHV